MNSDQLDVTRVDSVETSSRLRPARTVTEPAAPGRSKPTTIFARQVLVFPLLVVILACTSFFFGGRCAAWQWWTAVAAVIATPFSRKNQWCAALEAAGLFALLLFALRCLIPPLIWDDTECVDMPVYHLPMVQLLIEGWNPIADPLAEGITASLGLDLWGMAPLHVAFLPKTLAVFSAVAYTFIQDPYALTFPLLVFLWLGIFLEAVRRFRGFVRWSLVAALVFVLPMIRWQMPVDLALAFSSCGLLLTMQDSMHRKECDWLALTVWGAWMMNLKLNGVLGAFVFCALFVAAKTWKERAEWKEWIGRFIAFGGILVLLWGVISWNPLGVSWQRYGHPLYPFKTVDAERFPIKDLTWDLQGGNDDFHRMGKIGCLSHAFVAPTKTIDWYKWVLKDPDFSPFCMWWNSPEFLDAKTRLGLWIVFLVLFLFPQGRLWGLGGAILLTVVPDYLVGYLRYQPWLSALGCLSILFAAEWASKHMRHELASYMSLVVLCGLLLSGLNWCCIRSADIERKIRETVSNHTRILASFWPTPIAFYHQSFVCEHFTPRYNFLTCMENHVRLLVRLTGKDQSVTVLFPSRLVGDHLVDNRHDERNWHQETPPKEQSKTQREPGEEASNDPSSGGASESNTQDQEIWTETLFGYYVAPEKSEESINRFPAGEESETKHRSIGKKSQLVLHAWVVSYPRELWKRIVRWR